MIERLYATTLFALYQLSIALAIALVPVALLTRRIGYIPPVHHLIDRLGAAYAATRADSNA